MRGRVSRDGGQRADVVAVAERLDVRGVARGRDRRVARARTKLGHALAVVEVVVGQRDPADAAARLSGAQYRIEVLGRAGPGSITHAGSCPATQVLVPDSVISPGLPASTQATSCSNLHGAGQPAARRNTGPLSEATYTRPRASSPNDETCSTWRPILPPPVARPGVSRSARRSPAQ